MNTPVSIPHRVKIEPTRGWLSPGLGDLWRYKELLYFLIWRDVRVRFTQTALGVFWVVLQPILTTAVFAFLFGRLLKVPTDGVPYPVFAYAALLPWNYFASSLSRASGSVVTNANLVTKVYFPKLILPLAGVLSGLVDFCISLILMAGFMTYYSIVPSREIVMLLPLLFLAMITALGFGLWFSALNVRFRDVNLLIPFLLQIWLYVTPVIYSIRMIPERIRPLLGFNPMTTVVEGFRRSLLPAQFHDGFSFEAASLIPIAVSFVVFISGAAFFRHTERRFADII